MANKKIIFLSIILFLAFFANAKNARAMDVTAASCSRANVETAISQVQTAGAGTVYIPAGDCDWSGKGSSGTTVTGNVNIIGAGVGQTILRVTDGSLFFYWNPSSTKSTFFRLSGITFYSSLGCTSACPVSNGFAIRNTQNFRVDHCWFEGYYNSIGWKSVSKGLIDNNTFINHNVSVSGSYYGISGGMPYDGGPPNPIHHTDGDPNSLPRCSVTGSPDYQCDCEVGHPAITGAYSIAIGKTAIAGGTYVVSTRTIPATAEIKYSGVPTTGTVRRIYVDIASVSTSPTITVASFSGSGNTFTARARSSPLSVQTGSNIFSVDDGDFTAFAINDGDYIGVYLNNCTLSSSTRTGSTNWSISGDQTDQSAIGFGSPTAGRSIAIWAELFDDGGKYAACEEKWDTWYNDTTRGRGYYLPFDRNWTYPADDAIYIEDNTFTWYKSAVSSNWGGSSRMVIRYNTFYSETGMIVTWIKPGNQIGIWHNNHIEKLGVRGGYATEPYGGNVLFYDNTIKNFSTVGTYGGFRSFSDYYFPFAVRQKEMFVWNNTYDNCACGLLDSNCWNRAGESTYWQSQPGEKGVIHFRAPQPGEKFYGFTEYTYPHPLTFGSAPSFDTTPPAAPSGVSVS